MGLKVYLNTKIKKLLFEIFSTTYIHGALSFFTLSAIVLSSVNLFIGTLYLLFLVIKSLYSVFKKEKN
ncbi:hypothetical protein [Arcobacter sp.]|uniref:hypothetical protein n=1 Tax=Arcobacter sp. TaxID=1872629 RepID=UPI003D0FA63C